MDYQILVNIAVGVVTLMGGGVFKMILGHVNEIKEEHNELMKKHHDDVDLLKEKYTQLALSLPEKWVSFVKIASPLYCLIMSSISLSGVATKTSPTCDSLALFITWMIIGKLLILTKGFPGNLFAFKRAGIIIAVLFIFFMLNKIMRPTVAK